MTIAVIPKGTSHVFWQSIHAGAAKAAQELGVDIIWRGPLREDDRASQIAEVEGFITRGVSGIVLAPLDEAALVGPGRRRGAREDSCRHHRLGTEGRRLRQLRRDRQPPGRAHGGRRAREDAAARRQESWCCATPKDRRARTDREAGFLEEIAKHTNIQVLSSNQYGGADVEGAYKTSRGDAPPLPQT